MKPIDEPLTFNQYQNFTPTTAKYTGKDATIGTEPHFLGMCYLGLKFTGEAGEVSEKIGKLIRDGESKITPQFRQDIKKELGDVLWYISEMGNQLDISMEDIARANMIKLNDRKMHNVISSSGDER